MRVLFADHSTRASGAQRSLVELLEALRPHVEAVVAAPEGEVEDLVREAGFVTVRLSGARGSLRFHPRQTAQGVAALLAMGARLGELARRHRPDLIHANTVQASIACGVARSLGSPPVVAHIRDSLPKTTTGRAVRAWVARSADAVVANSAYTARSFARSAVVIPPTLDPVRFDPERADGRGIRRELGLSPAARVLAVLAQITPWKGQADAVKLLDGVRRHLPETHLLLVGGVKFDFVSTRFDNAAYLRRLHEIVADRDLRDHVHFLGERDDVPDLLAATDVLLVPSWEEPFGRAVIEAAAMGTPVVATDRGGPAEIIEAGRTGILLPPRDHEHWVPHVTALLEDADRRERMGAAARQRVLTDYSREAQGAVMLELYRQIAGRR